MYLIDKASPNSLAQRSKWLLWSDRIVSQANLQYANCWTAKLPSKLLGEINNQLDQVSAETTAWALLLLSEPRTNDEGEQQSQIHFHHL